MKVGELLREYRRAAGFTLEDVAHRAGTDGGNLSRIERGDQQPSVDLTRRLLLSLGVPYQAFFEKLDQDEGKITHMTDPRLVKLQANYKLLDKEKRDLLLDFSDLLIKRK
ncbi:helix-turn-helix domain-containing protein [Idiomarina xiamenensis]|uniref:XRE family transcriptional regulator n=1 Tax=Idiomarina xiamenensis 10-D-4 TaxID=740709 RepID=K2KJZ4_9GAMM|nr:helix-turn-helix transcriptional regulator [Idiomarina xiamenensis]EKE82929.1 XRE family transcriptional regulator [Idiomarina xiamenensis 10-D-4]